MKPGQLLTILLVSLLVLSFTIVMVGKDVLIQEPDYVPPSFLSIREVDVRPVEVTSSRIEVNVTAYIDHAGGKTRNATMLIRAINSGTGLLGEQVYTSIPETESEKTLAVSRKLRVERDGGYELKILIFNNGSIVDSGSVTIRGMNAITPQSKRSGVVLNNIDFTVSSVSKGNVGINSDIYLENSGPEPSENLRMMVKAREAASHLLADKKSSETGVIENETTAVRTVQLVVPDEYNYMVVVELWKGDVLINKWEKPVLLAPTKTVPKESMEKKVDIEVSKFEREGGIAGGPMEGRFPSPTPAYAMTPAEPGFEVLAAVLALLVVIALRRRS